MTVVANTTPLNYLVLIGEIDVLPRLYGQVFVPRRVMQELAHPDSPSPVRSWASTPPGWLEVRDVAVSADLSSARINEGEREVIALAEILTADLVIMDDRGGRQEATRRGLQLTGTLGVLDAAAEGGLLTFRDAAERLLRTSFRVNPAVLQPFLERDARRTP